jgi:hypothetical protein
MFSSENKARGDRHDSTAIEGNEADGRRKKVDRQNLIPQSRLAESYP